MIEAQLRARCWRVVRAMPLCFSKAQNNPRTPGRAVSDWLCLCQFTVDGCNSEGKETKGGSLRDRQATTNTAVVWKLDTWRMNTSDH